ncbi:MAG: cellulose synthase [Pedobacter sp.]|nr:cellulose synthase [Pedobacter sp.]
MIAIVYNCFTVLHEWYHYFYITVPATPAEIQQYSVDIFTTFCAGEPHKMVTETLLAIKAITYPHETYLCDEADDPYLRQFCKELGVHHVTRTLKVDAKAGNINNALRQSSGDLCVVLDPDHVPEPNFLDPIVSHFNNPDVGFVQVVQAYKNLKDGLIAKGAAQQTFQFYGPMMMTMNRYGTVMAIGANCTFRRKALDSIGGHAAGLAEDMHTAMQLHAKGWKSVYVPAVLARGLVPSTLSAYYSQQLKWSRGVFELLMVTYPKLFYQFTWKQKLHYFTLPFHYLSGLIILLNFLVPILSLFFSTSPLNIGVDQFFIMGLPLLTSIILIRHYVQWWVMENSERGFHAVGGLLMIGTWWIYILGLVYTILRKKVAYIPTPKDGHEGNNWPLNIPNICVLVLSIVAIIYGLYNDLNPYNLCMASFASVNCLIMAFNIVASRQMQIRRLRSNNQRFNFVMNRLQRVKRVFWVMRRQVYTGLRSAALLITILLCCLALFLIYWQETENQPADIAYKPQVNIKYGIFFPSNSNGYSSIKSVRQYASKHSVSWDIVSLYISWAEQKGSYLPLKEIDSIYKMGAVPMITWEPWQNLFVQNESSNGEVQNRKVFSKIRNGNYDKYLDVFSKQIKALRRPVYLRFAQEADNPFYPWSATGGNSPEEFKEAWKYVHRRFRQNGVNNIIWVWNPWKAEAIDTYFPGMEFVDWIGVTNLNYGLNGAGKKWSSMQELYEPFHQNRLLRSGLPVMLSEFGSERSAGNQSKWINDGIRAISTRYPEVKAVVMFNSSMDKNVPESAKAQSGSLNWSLVVPDSIKPFFKFNTPQVKETSPLLFGPRYLQLLEIPVVKTKAFGTGTSNFIKGVNYTKGQDWKNNIHSIRMDEIRRDFFELSKIGINTVSHYGPGIYDRNILRAANEYKLNLQYGFWISDQIDFVRETGILDDLSNEIINTVHNLKDNSTIKYWKIGNPVLSKIARRYDRQGAIYQEDAYLHWLDELVNAIVKEDGSRPVSIELELSDDLPRQELLVRSYVKNIMSYGLIRSNRSPKNVKRVIGELKLPYHLADGWQIDGTVNASGFFIGSWQDEIKGDHISLTGLRDFNGRNKLKYYELKHDLLGTPIPSMPEIRILKQAVATDATSDVSYFALVEKAGKWVLPDARDHIHFEWKLMMNDQHGHPIQITQTAESPSVVINIPRYPETYRLYLFGISGDKVVIVSTELNTPLNGLLKSLKY